MKVLINVTHKGKVEKDLCFKNMKLITVNTVMTQEKLMEEMKWGEKADWNKIYLWTQLSTTIFGCK